MIALPDGGEADDRYYDTGVLTEEFGSRNADDEDHALQKPEFVHRMMTEGKFTG